MPCWNDKDFLIHFNWFYNALSNFHDAKSQNTETLKKIKMPTFGNKSQVLQI